MKETFTIEGPKKWRWESKVTIPPPQEESGEDVAWMYEMIGWKKDTRKSNRSK